MIQALRDLVFLTELTKKIQKSYYATMTVTEIVSKNTFSAPTFNNSVQGNGYSLKLSNAYQKSTFNVANIGGEQNGSFARHDFI